VAGLEKNQATRFKRSSDDSILVEDESGVEHLIRGNELVRVSVCDQKELDFRSGEQLQLKTNLKTREGLRLANGSILTLARVDPETGDIEVKDRQGRLLRLDPSVRMLQYGYASTSYGSQGKTVDHVLISDSQCKAATNQKEFYVSISRGRETVAIYTTDREALRDHVQRLGERELALDLERECQ
jgi:ATP-dependent exoDNAse (exonuclease V) alpha subunit